MQLASCVEYMSVFNQIIDETVDPRLQTVTTRDADERQLSTFRAIKKKIPELISDENHCLQTHIIDLQYFVSICYGWWNFFDIMLYDELLKL